jgi:CheY-specific phosphatase CheX
MQMPHETHEVDFSQCLVNAGKFTPAELVEHLQDLPPEEWDQKLAQALDEEELDVEPIHAAVQKVAAATGNEYGQELELYSDYMCSFLNCCREALGVPCVVSTTPVTIDNQLQGVTYTVSQQITGDVSLVGSIMAQEPVFLAIASAYSHMQLTDAESDIAADSVQEFVNVYTGLFGRELAARHLEVELELPRCGVNVSPDGSHQLALRIFSGLGVFDVILAIDEFF